MPWLAVLRKPSQTQCLTLPIPSHQTDRNLCRLQFKTWTTEQFCCDFWKLSLQHSPLSPAAPKAQPEPHGHITNTSSLCPGPGSPVLIAGLGGELWQFHREGQGSAELCWAPSTGTASHEPRNDCIPLEQRQEECPSVGAQTRNHYFPCSSTNSAPVEFPAHICQETFLENGERRGGTVAHLLWTLNGKHAPSNWDREVLLCPPLTQRAENSGRDPMHFPLIWATWPTQRTNLWNYVYPEKYQLGNPAWLWEAVKTQEENPGSNPCISVQGPEWISLGSAGWEQPLPARGLGGGPVMETEVPGLPQALGRGCTDRFPCFGCCHGCSEPPIEPGARRPSLPCIHQRQHIRGRAGWERRGRSFKHCQVSATGGKQVQRQQELLKVFDIVPGGLPNACKRFKGGSPFHGHGNVSKEPQSVQCFKDHCSLKIPARTPHPAENLPKQIPSWLTPAEEVCAAT